MRAVKPDFELTADNADAIAAICRELDGAPLALELAAARIRTLAPAAMLARLDRRLPLLSAGAKDLPPRQQTLRRTIEWSPQLLGPDEKRLLALLGVFAGGFSLEAAEFVAGDAAHADPLTSLGILVDNSLVREQDCRGRSRFSRLATVREHALEQLEASGTFEAIRARDAFNESLATSAALGHAEGVAYGLEKLIAIAAAEGEIQRAGRLLRAAEALRRQTGLYNATSFSFHQHYLAPILAGDDVSDLEAARTEGRDMSIEDVVAFALAGHAS